MAKIAVVGACGKMGTLISEEMRKMGHSIVEIDKNSKKYQKITQFNEKIDLIIDFSHKSLSLEVLDYCEKNKIKLIIGTTGQGDFFYTQLETASKTIPIIKCENFSINVLKYKNLCFEMSKKFEGRVAVIEFHNKSKPDVPSGTARAVAEKIVMQDNNKTTINSCSVSFEDETVDIFSVRGGTIFGRHEVHFFGEDEEIIISHSVFSRKPFLAGLRIAVEFLLKEEKSGLYSFDKICSSV